MENTPYIAKVMWFKEPETLADFDPEIWRNTFGKSTRAVTMFYLHWAVYKAKKPASEETRQYVRKYVTEFPEFVAEIRELRPELLEM